MAAKYRWGVLGSSVIGASHVRSGKPNQDAIKHTAQETLPMVLALSDGHGSASSFRSDIGSKLAVDAAIDTLLEFIDQVGNISASKRKGLAEEKLPRLLVENWAGAVDVHRGENPFTVSETKQVIRAAASMVLSSRSIRT